MGPNYPQEPRIIGKSVQTLGITYVGLSRVKQLSSLVFERHGQMTLKIVRDYEKDLSRFNKTSLDIGFLQKCKLFHIFPAFLNFKLSKEEFHETRACRQFKQDLLNYELNQKFSLRRNFQKSYESACFILQTIVSKRIKGVSF